MQSEQYKYFEEQLKQAANGYEPMPTETAWAHMEAKLDKRENHKLALLGRLWWLDDIFFLAVILVLLMVPTQKNLQPQTVTVKASIDSSNGAPHTNNNDNNGGTDGNIVPQANNSKTPKTAQSNISKLTPTTQDAVAALKGTQSKSAAPNHSLIINEEQEAASSTTQLFTNRTSNSTENQNDYTILLPNSNMAQKLTRTNVVSSNITTDAALFFKPYTPITYSLLPPVAIPSIQYQATAPKQLTQSKPIQRFGIVAIGSSEWTTAKDGNSTKAGLGGGLLITYQLNKKISIQTGLMYSRKLYEGGPNTYNPKPGSYWDIVTLTAVEADCEVWEIPLRATYTFKQHKKYVLYGMGGIAAAIMKKESYEMYYTRLNGQPGYATPVYTTGKTHALSSAMVGAGYTRRVGNHINLMAEPFVKLPLSGVGEGKIKLISGGINIGIHYGF